MGGHPGVILPAYVALHIHCHLNKVDKHSDAYKFVHTPQLLGASPHFYLNFPHKPYQGPLGPLGLRLMGDNLLRPRRLPQRWPTSGL